MDTGTRGADRVLAMQVDPRRQKAFPQRVTDLATFFFQSLVKLGLAAAIRR
jgi:hypothetical protein